MKKRLIITICFLKQTISLLLKVLIFKKKLVPYDLLIYSLDNHINLINSAEIQGDFFKAIITVKIFISNITDVTDQSEEEKNKIFAKQENVLNNAKMLLIKRGDLIDQFSKNNIISMGEQFYDAP